MEYPFLLVFVLSACTATGTGKKVSKGLKHDTPLIKDDVKKLGKAEVDKTVKMGPTPAEADVIKLKKRKKLSINSWWICCFKTTSDI